MGGMRIVVAQHVLHNDVVAFAVLIRVEHEGSVVALRVDFEPHEGVVGLQGGHLVELLYKPLDAVVSEGEVVVEGDEVLDGEDDFFEFLAVIGGNFASILFLSITTLLEYIIYNFK